MPWPLHRKINALLLVSLALLAALAVLWQPAFAQYPAPVGGVTSGVSTTTLPAGSSTTLTCTVLDTAGNPVAGEPCTFTIVSEPGSDAALGSKSITKLTNAQGIATAQLFTGSTAGQMVIRTEARGVASLTTMVVQAPAVPAPVPAPPPLPAQPPATGVSSQSERGFTWWPLGLAATAWLVIGGVLFLRRRRA